MAKQVVKRRNGDSLPPLPGVTGTRRSPTGSGLPPTAATQGELRELLRVFLAMREGDFSVGVAAF